MKVGPTFGMPKTFNVMEELVYKLSDNNQMVPAVVNGRMDSNFEEKMIFWYFLP